MQTCPQCGRENAADARFCSNCGAALAVEAEPAREERKVVTVLFADLVGFTSRAEQMDPEDVRAVLEPYHARLRQELEQRGGTVEKFIGDAVMALFGAPIAHEDDPERAVRAALAIRDWIREEGELQLRIGITTGEALVALGARPERARAWRRATSSTPQPACSPPLRSTGSSSTRRRIAPPGSAIDVPRGTSRSRRRGRPSRSPSGRSSRHARASASTSRRHGGAPLVGRERELDCSSQRARARAAGAVAAARHARRRARDRQEPARLRALRARSSDEPELIYWRQGRCLPYGEGVTFWALSEMVKAHAGILETDSAEQAQREARRGRRRGARRRIGRATGSRATSARWSASPRTAARRRPPGRGVRGLAAVLRGARRAEPARPRLRGPALGRRQPARLHRPPRRLGDRSSVARRLHGPPGAARRGAPGGAEASRTRRRSRSRPCPRRRRRGSSHALLERAVLPADVQTTLIERAGGNPLYAEEFARMVDSATATRPRSGSRSPCRASSRRASTRSRSRRSCFFRTPR